MQNMRAFKTACPLRNELHLDITTVVKVTVVIKTKIYSCLELKVGDCTTGIQSRETWHNVVRHETDENSGIVLS